MSAELGLNITALLPYDQDLCRRDLDSEPDRTRFDRLCASSEVRVLEPPVGANPADLEHPGELRDRQHRRAGGLIAGYSGLLIAVWNGRDTSHRAGTARTVEFRRRGAIPTDDLALPPGDVLLSAQDDDLMFEIRCGRVSHPSREGVAVICFTGGGAPGGTEYPPSLRTTLARLGELNRDAQRFAVGIARCAASSDCSSRPYQVTKKHRRVHGAPALPRKTA